MVKEKPYTLTHDKERLIFITSSFRAEKESVLHQGIYSNELASMLTALTITGIVYVIIAFNYSVNIFHYIILIIIFILSFIGLRESIFKERQLKVVFDKSNRIARITRPGIVLNKTETIPFDDIDSVRVGSKRIQPENIEGIEFVERISRQHGSAVPGLGEETEFVTLNLRMRDGSERLIYANRIRETINGEPEIPLREIRDFLNK